MNVFTFSLPEGCDLKLKTDWATATVHVTYKGMVILHLSTMILGEKTVVRRRVGGASFVVQGPDPMYTCDHTKLIRKRAKEYREGLHDLHSNLKHLEGSRIDPSTMHRIRAAAEETFRRTRTRMDLASVVEVTAEEERRWVDNVFNESPARYRPDIMEVAGLQVRVDEFLREDAIAIVRPQTVPVMTRGVLNVDGGRYFIRDHGLLSRTGQEVPVTADGSTVNIRDFDA